MKSWMKKVALVLLLVLLGACIFIVLQKNKLTPEYATEIEITGLKENVAVYWDSSGVPHIEAANEHDLLIAAGYITARERLFQMEMTRRMASGRLSEVIGRETLKFDKYFRILGLDSLAHSLFRNSSMESQQWCRWYSQGVNAFIEEGNLPIEFSILGFSPEFWQPSDCWLPARLMAWFMNFSWKGDWLYGELKQKLPAQLFREIVPVWTGGPDIIPAADGLHAFGELLKIDREARRFLHWPDGPIGSNNWVVSPALNESGAAVLANDPHLPLQFPPVWFEMHWKTPHWEAAGFGLPGTPGIVIGRNQDIAWGVTNGMIDDCDLFVLSIDSVASTYQYGGQPLPLKRQLLQIEVKGEEPVFLNRYETRHGPLVNGLFEKKLKGQDVALKWAGYQMSDEMHAFIQLCKSRNWAEFSAAFESYTVPCQNMVYADRHGNIGYRLIGKIPVRSYKSGFLPVDGGNTSNNWLGWLEEGRQPSLFNPEQGYIVTANNRIAANIYLSEMWEPPFRARRIIELIEQLKPLTLNEHQRIQNDVANLFAKDHLDELLSSLKSHRAIQKKYADLIALLDSWNYEMARESVAACVFEYWQKQIIENTFKDEMGDELFRLFTDYPGFYWRIYDQVLKNKESLWYDNKQTEKTEVRNDILTLSFEEAVDSLDKKLGPDISAWEWGALHQLELAHPLGRVAVTRLAFNKGPKPSSGNALTVNVGAYKFAESFSQKIGASTRFLMNWSQADRYYKILPGGNSGRFLSPYYGDQFSNWLEGKYKYTLLQKYRGGERMLLKKKKNI